MKIKLANAKLLFCKSYTRFSLHKTAVILLPPYYIMEKWRIQWHYGLNKVNDTFVLVRFAVRLCYLAGVCFRRFCRWSRNRRPADGRDACRRRLSSDSCFGNHPPIFSDFHGSRSVVWCVPVVYRSAVSSPVCRDDDDAASRARSSGSATSVTLYRCCSPPDDANDGDGDEVNDDDGCYRESCMRTDDN